MAALTKAEISRAVAEELGFPNNQAARLVDTVIDLVKLSLTSGEEVLISGFGRFNVKAKKARKGRNPATNESMMLKPRKVVTFHCSGKLRQKLNP